MSSTSAVKPSLGFTDTARHTAWHQKAKDFPNEVLPRHPGYHSVGHVEEYWHLKETVELTIEEQPRKKWLQWFDQMRRISDKCPPDATIEVQTNKGKQDCKVQSLRDGLILYVNNDQLNWPIKKWWKTMRHPLVQICTTFDGIHFLDPQWVRSKKEVRVCVCVCTPHWGLHIV